MYLSGKKIDYADLVIPFTKCPFKKVEHDCPFVKYWRLASVEKQVEAMENLSEEELDILREQHRFCQDRKIKKAKNQCILKRIIGSHRKN